MDDGGLGTMHRVATISAIPSDRGMAVTVGEHEMLLVRDGDDVRAFAAKCPHAGAPLAEGAVCAGRIVCPWHKAEFRLADGALVEPPALEGLARFPVRVDAGGDVFVGIERLSSPAPARQADPRTIVVLGAGAAGAAAVAGLREFGFDGRLVLVGNEKGDPYDRTALSKFVMSGDMAADDVPSLWPDGFLAAHDVERIETEAVALDAAARSIRLADGRSLAYDSALVATGGVPVTPSIPGLSLAGVHTLRSRAEAAAITASLRDGARVVILGGSFIGLEIASALRGRSLEVTIVTPEAVPFTKQFGARLGQVFKSLHQANGVEFQFERQAVRLEGDGRVERVVLDDGSVLAADVVLLGTGVRPATDFVRGLDLAEDGGIPVDAEMRAAPGLYAAGDIARFPLDGGSTRIEHWRVAQQQARVAARNMLGDAETYRGVPFFWTYHFGLRFEYLGHATSWDDVVFEGDVDEHRFVAFLVKDGDVAGVLACQRERATAVLIERLRAKLPLDAALQIVRAV